MKILVSGFDSFGTHNVNPTERLARAVQERPHEFLAPPHEVRGIVLPTKFGAAFDILAREIAIFDPDAVLAVGLADGRGDAVELERVAINCVDAEIADNDGHQPQGAAVLAGAAPAYFSTLPLVAMREKLRQMGIGAKISNSAGTYVCNELMFRLLEAQRFTRRRAGFVHVPYLPEQGTPSMPFPTMTAALAGLLDALVTG